MADRGLAFRFGACGGARTGIGAGFGRVFCRQVRAT
eukprot:CAMPEP_0117647294 /NCGR_PEP_ID=MMETSP0802-20121206/12533_1 /TAXON_ID=38833 /ORGANISM="Micromonas sp., Strain CCMP2099" /LENGTH=35 /DNA_ID= /DNA_START= /DNA_END= /DNA_ORIENTATION=